jgi:hypothetical protein
MFEDPKTSEEGCNLISPNSFVIYIIFIVVQNFTIKINFNVIKAARYSHYCIHKLSGILYPSLLILI